MPAKNQNFILSLDENGGVICSWLRCADFAFGVFGNMARFLIWWLRPDHVLADFQNVGVIESLVAFIESSENEHLALLDFTGRVVATGKRDVSRGSVFDPLVVFGSQFESVDFICGTHFPFGFLHDEASKKNESSFYF